MSAQTFDRIQFVTRHFNELQGLRTLVPLGLITLSIGGATYFDNRPLVVLRALLFLAGAILLLGARRYYRRRFGEVESEPAGEGSELQSLSVYSPAGRVSGLRGSETLPPRARFLLIALGFAFTVFFVAHAIVPAVQIWTDESLVQPPWATLDSVVLFQEDWTVGILDIIDRPTPGPSTEKAVAGQLLYALCGALFLGTWLWRGRRWSQGHHLVLGLMLLGLSAAGTCVGFVVWEDRDLAVRIINFLLPALVDLWVALILCGASLILAGLLDHRQIARVLHPVREETV